MPTYQHTPPDIRSLNEDEIFVFGSNTQGRHGKGAAKFAMQKFGAKWGVAEGLTGRCYALPTVGDNLSFMSKERIAIKVRRFYECAKEHPELTFLVTLVGCGLAGHKVKDIAPMFAKPLPNVVIPEEFADYNAHQEIHPAKRLQSGHEIKQRKEERLYE